MNQTGDGYGKMMGEIRDWLEGNHPGARYAVLVVHLDDGVPDVQVPVIPASSSVSSPIQQPQ